MSAVGNVVFRRPLPLESETALFILVSALDLFMTSILLHHQAAGGGRFYESNPIADYFLKVGGLSGLVYFKFTMVAVVVVIIHCIALSRLKAARRLFGFATLAGSAVVLYSFALLLQHTTLL
jgi:hypothetical protein